MDAAARSGKSITYSQLVDQITVRKFVDQITVRKFLPYDPALSQLLTEISRREDKEGRGLLSAVVVHQDAEGLPGDGFFELAAELGRDVSDRRACWEKEFKLTCAAHRNARPPRRAPTTDRPACAAMRAQGQGHLPIRRVGSTLPKSCRRPGSPDMCTHTRIVAVCGYGRLRRISRAA